MRHIRKVAFYRRGDTREGLIKKPKMIERVMHRERILREGDTKERGVY